jgi:hypothetical protein
LSLTGGVAAPSGIGPAGEEEKMIAAIDPTGEFGGSRVSDLDSVAAAELARARRHRHSLSVVTASTEEPIGLFRRYPRLRKTAALFASSIRVNDVVGYLSRNRIAVVLPYTDRIGSISVVTRVLEALEEELYPFVRVGAASFPDEEVTWEGLKWRAAARELPLGDVAPAAESLPALLFGLVGATAELSSQIADGHPGIEAAQPAVVQ